MRAVSETDDRPVDELGLAHTEPGDRHLVEERSDRPPAGGGRRLDDRGIDDSLPGDGWAGEEPMGEDGLDDGELDDAVGAAKVSAHGVRREHARAKIFASLFGEPADPVKLDRFVILDKLGQGGMGVVYSAYDPELDRRVALKLLQTGRRAGDPDAHERLLREAQALARLSHPNVVPVHDVGVIDDQVFVVMEFVLGRDLRKWADQAEPDWRDALDAYRQAGAGLAAAHAADIVHRDFKPDNAIMGVDGRVRVLDFGLARERTEEQSEDGSDAQSEGRDGSAVSPRVASELAMQATLLPDEAPPPLADRETGPGHRTLSRSQDTGRQLLQVSMTATGAFMGTPAYMSPEQFSGKRVGPASDQFSFCVSLYEALYRQRPFTGNTLQELGASLVEGTVAEPRRGTGVPGWLFPIVRRGLQTEPGDRHPSMEALLAELANDPARARRRWLLLAAVIALVIGTAGGVYAWTSGQKSAEVDVCAGGDELIAQVWNPQRKLQVTTAITDTGHPYAASAVELVAGKLDTYARAWADMHHGACMAHQRGEQSGDLLDKRMACLDGRRDALESAVGVLVTTERSAVANTVLVAEKLPFIDYCANVEALNAEVPPPQDPAAARRVAELRKRLADVKAEEDSGQYERPLATVSEVLEEAEQLKYRPLVAQALLMRGRMLLGKGEREASIEPLTQATLLGLRSSMDRVALEALARRVYAQGTATERVAEALAEVPTAAVLAERIPDRLFVHALLLNNAGSVFLADGKRALARAYFERALAVKNSGSGSSPVELINIYRNLAIVSDNTEQRSALFRKVRDEFTEVLGPNHPDTLNAMIGLAGYTSNPERAFNIFQATCDKYWRFHPSHLDNLSDCFFNSGFAGAESGDSEGAITAFDKLSQILAASEDKHYVYRRSIARGYVSQYRGQHADATLMFKASLAGLPDMDGQPWWMQVRAADAKLGLGISEYALREYDLAIEALEQALPVFENATRLANAVRYPRQFVLTKVWLAKALHSGAAHRVPSDTADNIRTRVVQLLTEADHWYRRAGAGYEWRLRELAAWRAANGLEPTER